MRIRYYPHPIPLVLSHKKVREQTKRTHLCGATPFLRLDVYVDTLHQPLSKPLPNWDAA